MHHALQKRIKSRLVGDIAKLSRSNLVDSRQPSVISECWSAEFQYHEGEIVVLWVYDSAEGAKQDCERRDEGKLIWSAWGSGFCANAADGSGKYFTYQLFGEDCWHD